MTDPVDQAIAVLNRALAADPEAIERFISLHVAVNTDLANDPTIQVIGLGEEQSPIPESYVLRPLGLINGLFGVDDRGVGHIAVELDDKGRINRFVRTPRGKK